MHARSIFSLHRYVAPLQNVECEKSQI